MEKHTETLPNGVNVTVEVDAFQIVDGVEYPIMLNLPNTEAYIVEYSTGNYEDFRTHQIFVTHNKKTAEAYVKRFNAILKKWKDHYDQYTDKATNYIKNDVHIQFERWHDVRNCHKCEYRKIELR